MLRISNIDQITGMVLVLAIILSYSMYEKTPYYSEVMREIRNPLKGTLGYQYEGSIKEKLHITGNNHTVEINDATIEGGNSNTSKETKYEFNENPFNTIGKDKNVELIINTNEQISSKQAMKYFNEMGITNIEKRNEFLYIINVHESIVTTTINSLKFSGWVRIVEPNFYVQLNQIPNDLEWSQQWSLAKINVTTGWSVSKGNKDVKIAILDSGIDYTHVDLSSQYDPTGIDWVNGDADPMDDNGHGTHIAGIVAAEINNSMGIAGIANISLIAEKCLNSEGIGTIINAANAIDHAIETEVDIISISWGSYEKSLIIEDRINEALSNDIIVIASVGNDGIDKPIYPAALAGVIAVTSTDSSDNLAYQANYGDWIDVAAPGEGILSTQLGGGYCTKSGTSIATPHVVGLAALIRSFRPEYTLTQIETIIKMTTEDVGESGFDGLYGWGRINIGRAMESLLGHNVRGVIKSSKKAALGFNKTIQIYLTNTGLTTEYGVKVYTYVNSSLLNIKNIPILEAGNFTYVENSLEINNTGWYNVSIYVLPQTGESYVEDNRHQIIIHTVNQTLFPQIGNKISYGSFDMKPYLEMWEVILVNSEQEVIIQRTNREENLDTSKRQINFTLNTYTREFSGHWELFPFWINTTNFMIGTYTDIHFIDKRDGLVVGETNYTYYGSNITTWIINCSENQLYYSKDSGILVKAPNQLYMPQELIYSDILTEVKIHNIRCEFNNNNIHINQITTFNVLLQNTGMYTETIELFLFSNSSLVQTTSYTLNQGDFNFSSIIWKPETIGNYNITLFSQPVVNEAFLADNLQKIWVFAGELNNYSVYNVPFKWFDALNKGKEVELVQGGNTMYNLSLPFSFEFYGLKFSNAYIAPFGKVYFIEKDIPDISEFNYPIENNCELSVFGSQLEAYDTIYYWNTTDFVVIEYNNVQYSIGMDAGTFEIVLYRNGTINFNYKEVSNDLDTIKGANYGYNLSYYSLANYDLTGISNFSLLLTSEYFEYHDVKATLETEKVFFYGSTTEINITIENNGNYNESEIYISFLINGSATEVISGNVLSLEAGQMKRIIYEWVPTSLHYTNITVKVLVIGEEHLVDDNRYSIIQEVRGVIVLSPKHGEQIEADYVVLTYDVTNIEMINTITLKFEGVEFFVINHFLINEIYVPLINNGTNHIMLCVSWKDNKNASMQVSINASYPELIQDIMVGDYFEWEITNLDNNTKEYFRYLITEWVTQYVVNISVTQYDTSMQESYWILVNLINNYILESSNKELINKPLTMFQNYNRSIVPLLEWNIVTHAYNITDWEGNEVKSYRANTSTYNYETYYLLNNGLWIGYNYQDEYKNISAKLIESNRKPPAELDAPYLSSPNDMNFFERTKGIKLKWEVFDENPGEYCIFKNWVLIKRDIWSQSEIVVLLDNLSPNTYNFTIIVEDKFHNFARDTVFVIVENIADPPIVTLLNPLGNGTISGTLIIIWTAMDPDNDTITTDIFYWEGTNWVILVERIHVYEFSWDTTVLQNGEDYKIRIIVKDGTLQTVVESTSFEIFNRTRKKPIHSITILNCLFVITILVIMRKKVFIQVK